MRPGPSRERVAQPPRKLGEGRLVGREAETASRDRAWDEAGHPLWSQVSEKCAVLGSSAAWFSNQWTLGLPLPSEALQVSPLTASTFGSFPRAPRGLQRI